MQFKKQDRMSTNLVEMLLFEVVCLFELKEIFQEQAAKKPETNPTKQTVYI